MPHKIRERKGKVQVVNTRTGHIKAKDTTKTKAQRQVNLLRGVKHGWEPTGQPHSPTGRHERDWEEPF